MLWNLPQDPLVEKLGVEKKIDRHKSQFKIRLKIMKKNDMFHAPMFKCFLFHQYCWCCFGNGCIYKLLPRFFLL